MTEIEKAIKEETYRLRKAVQDNDPNEEAYYRALFVLKNYNNPKLSYMLEDVYNNAL